MAGKGKKNAGKKNDKIPREKPSYCGKCDELLAEDPKKVDEEAVECDCCSNFFHITCVGVSKRKLAAIAEFEVYYYCPSCELSASTLKEECTKLRSDYTQMKNDVKKINETLKKHEERLKNLEKSITETINERFDALEAKIGLSNPDEDGSELRNDMKDSYKTLQEKVIDLENKINNRPPPLPNDSAVNNPTPPKSFRNIIAEQLEEQLKEKLEDKFKQDEESKLREKKKNNLIFFNIPELLSDNIEEKMKADFYKIKNAYTERVVLNESDVTVVTRIGKKNPEADKPRPVILTFKNEEKRLEILRKNKDLELIDDNFETIKIYVTTDKTIKQRETEKALREEIKTRKSNGENDLVIRNEKIVPFRPGAQKSWAALFH